ncbi:hypothetical protein [Cellulomonas xiejunii]|uniref:WXG100 family type VII secretion target n=1 Tax=Cellulomonas xiejunii TaxID=2968083 RepID=A0ABY5KT38_9CELL|nr:hypothetical protein [Cellulomonas xiejunii]MCC2319556.1 hypothetical protein [Cellulomonas xiejunii]UUI71498.1 hypothetical protein NP048_17160 [Cellulomonas xiejunii]
MDLGVLERSPEAGDVEAVDGLVAGYLARAERFATRAVSVRAAGDGLVGASVGEWASALGERSVRLASGWDDAADGCRQVAEVLAGYGAALRGLERRVMAARDEVETARVRAVAARERYAVAALAGGVGAVPWSWTDVPAFAPVPEAADELRVWRAAVGDAAAGLRAFVACCDEREDLDRQTAARLVGVEVMGAYAPGTGVDAVVDVPLVQALAASSAGTVTAEQRAFLARWFAETVDAVVDDPQDSAAVGSLTGFVEAWSGDAGVMSAVFLALGGARTVRLLTALGYSRVHEADQRNAAVVASAAAIRSGLATGSSAWTPAMAQAFAAGMVSLATTSSDVRSVIGYLFADSSGARMSESFTVAMADQLDAVERGRGEAWRDGPSSVGQGLTDPGAITLGLAVHDPAAHVLATLGAYPQAARDWLTGGTVDWSLDRPRFDRDRIEYWFGQRDWSTVASDGFAGLGALWAGIQSAEAPLLAQQAAAINTLVFEQLQVNAALLRTENISEAGSLRLAQAIEAQLPGLIEVGVIRGPESPAVAWERVATPFAAGGVVTATVTRHELVRVLAAATSQTAGYAHTRDALLAYEAAALNAATEGTASPSLVMKRLAAVWGVADGAINGAMQAEHQRASDQVRSAVGLAGVPVDAALALVPHPIVALGLDAAVGHIEETAIKLLTPDELPPVFVRMPDAEPIQQYFARASHTFRSADLWDGPALREDSAVQSTSLTDGAVFKQTYDDVSGAMRLAITESAANDAKEVGA